MEKKTPLNDNSKTTAKIGIAEMKYFFMNV